MALPNNFGNLSTGNHPAALLDQNFQAVAVNTVMPCTASGTNSVTLTPLSGVPTLVGYQNYIQFSFFQAVTSTGAVTIRFGALPSLNAYLGDGATIAGAGAVVGGSLYFATYSSALNSGSGGFVITGGKTNENLQSMDSGQWTGQIVVAYLGDSRTIGSVGTAWPATIANHVLGFVTADIHNFGVGGQTLATAAANYSITAKPISPTGQQRGYLFIVCAAINDFLGGATAAATFAILQNLIATATADGWSVVIATEPAGSSLSGPQNTQRIAYNALITAWHTSPNRLARLDLVLTDPTDTNSYVDGVHFTADGADRVAGLVGISILGNQPMILANGVDSRTIGKLGVGLETREPQYLLDLQAFNTSGAGFPLISITDLSSGGHQFWLYARAASTAATFSLFDNTSGLARWTSNADGGFLVGSNAFPGTSTATPLYVDIGSTFSNSAGAHAKLRLYNDGTNVIGLGVSTNSMDFIATGAVAYNWYSSSALIATLSTGGSLTAVGNLTLGTAGGTGGSVLLKGATSGTVSLSVAAAAGTSTIFQLPATNGTSGFVLQTDGAGVTSWVATASTAATQANQETATSLTTFVSPGRQQFHPSASKAWGVTNQTGVQALLASYNVTSITDGGNGVTTFTYTNAMSSANYAVGACVNIGTVNVAGETGRLAASFTLTATNAGTPTDSTAVHIVVMGDLP